MSIDSVHELDDPLDEICQGLTIEIQTLEKNLEILIEVLHHSRNDSLNHHLSHSFPSLQNSDGKIPSDLEPVDPEKKILKERLNILEVRKEVVAHITDQLCSSHHQKGQLKTMTERYVTLNDTLLKLRTETYKLRQKLKVSIFIHIELSHTRTRTHNQQITIV